MKLLDTTIRDGSYALDFKWTYEDVEKIISRTERLGFEYIEIGHGLGLNASSAEHGHSLLSDSEYMQVANKTLTKAKYGFFCIPNIARLEDLNSVKDNGASFVRIGVNVNTPELAIKYIQHAKKIGLEVMTNYMKSYAVSPKDFASSVIIACDAGSDVVYMVDSAGCMIPDEIEKYFIEYKKISNNIKLGFHGHNNLGMAVANSIKCTQLGFDFIDCSLQGLGRSIGNAPTEQLVMALLQHGYNIDMDIPCLLEWGYDCIKDVSDRKVMHPLDLICGYTGFHSSYLKYIYKCSNEKKVDPLRLIIEYTKTNILTMDYDELLKTADKLQIDTDDNPYSFRKFFSESFNDN